MSATWRKHAACRGIDPDVFYPVSDEEADEAKAICDQCAVREACLEHALANREREGIWGGRPSASVGASTASAASPPDRPRPSSDRHPPGPTAPPVVSDRRLRRGPWRWRCRRRPLSRATGGRPGAVLPCSRPWRGWPAPSTAMPTPPMSPHRPWWWGAGGVLHRHRRLDRWLQPGGHLEQGETAAEAALRRSRRRRPAWRRPSHDRSGTGARRRARGDGRPCPPRHPLPAGRSGCRPAPPPGESQEVAWFSWEDAAALADDALAGALRTARRLSTTGPPHGAGGTSEESDG